MTLLKSDWVALYLPGGVIIKTGGVRELGPRLILDDKGIEGLDSAPSVRREIADRAFSHGAFPEVGHYGPRYVTFSGYALTDTPGQLNGLRDALRAALDPTQPGQLGIGQASRRQRSVTYYGGELTWDRQTDTRARWQVELYCPDPHIYGDEKSGVLYSNDLSRSGLDTTNLAFPLVYNTTITAEESDVIDNEGNATAHPVFRFKGNTDGITIKDGHRVMTYAGMTDDKTELMIDTYTGEVRYGESDRSYLLTSRDWITIPPESAITPTVDFIASPETEAALQIQVTWRDTYL